MGRLWALVSFSQQISGYINKPGLVQSALQGMCDMPFQFIGQGAVGNRKCLQEGL